MNTYKVVGLSLSLLVLQGCSSNGVNPEDANIFQATHGVSSGEFERQTQKKRQERDRSKMELDKASADNKVLQSELVNLKKEKSRLDKELSALATDNKNMQRTISAMSNKNAADKQKRIKAQSRLTQLNAKLNQLKSQRLNLPVGSYQQKIKQLKRDIESLKSSL